VAKPTVFFCSAPDTDERAELAERMFRHWQGLDVDLRLLTPDVLDCSPFEFQRERRVFAEKTAPDWFYIVADDDYEMTTPIDLGINALNINMDFAILSAWPQNAHISRWTPENYEPVETLTVMEHTDVGGVRFMRKGCFNKGWPKQTRWGYDREQAEMLRATGWRVGYSIHCRGIHHGEGHTTIWDKEIERLNARTSA
jgi:hypothetical protein